MQAARNVEAAKKAQGKVLFPFDLAYDDLVRLLQPHTHQKDCWCRTFRV